MSTVGIVVQARMGSTRLPGKVMRDLDGRPMIDHVLLRLKACRLAGRVILATSDFDADTPLADHVAAGGFTVFRGSETDVLDRFYQCAKAHGLAHVVRATGDNPFVDTQEADRLIEKHVKAGLDYTSATPEGGCRLPVGVGVEIMTVSALERSWRDGRQANHREHVNEYILENPEIFDTGRLDTPSGKAAETLHLTVDTADELAAAERLLKAYRAGDGEGFPGTEWLIAQSARS